MTTIISRRGALTALGALGVSSMFAFDSKRLAQAKGRWMLLVDERDAQQAMTMVEATLGKSSHFQCQMIGSNPVRQWRDGLMQETLSSPYCVALVRWDNALILAGLAREAQRRTRVNELPEGLFSVEFD